MKQLRMRDRVLGQMACRLWEAGWKRVIHAVISLADANTSAAGEASPGTSRLLVLCVTCREGMDIRA